VGLAQRQGERGRLARDADQVDVIRHQAVAQQRHAVLLTLVAQSLDVGSPVFVDQEDVLAIVAPLGDVVRNALHDHTGHSRHRRVLPV
jgi:hypothetical protein